MHIWQRHDQAVIWSPVPCRTFPCTTPVPWLIRSLKDYYSNNPWKFIIVYPVNYDDRQTKEKHICGWLSNKRKKKPVCTTVLTIGWILMFNRHVEHVLMFFFFSSRKFYRCIGIFFNWEWPSHVKNNDGALCSLPEYWIIKRRDHIIWSSLLLVVIHRNQNIIRDLLLYIQNWETLY